MTNRPNKQDFEKVALEFAKEMIDFSDDAVISEDIIERATNMAIDWLEGVSLRSKIFEQQYAKWVDLAETDISNLILEENKKYWFMALEYGANKSPKLIHGIFKKSVMSNLGIDGEYLPRHISFAEIQDDEGVKYFAQYVILEGDSLMFTRDFEPLAPKALRVEE